MHRVRQRNRSRSVVGAAVLLLCVSSPGSNDDPTLQTVRLLIEQGRYAEADELARAITAQTSVSSGDRPAELAAALALFADAARRNGRYMDADVLESAERALSIREHELGPGHHDTADSLAVLGRLHFDRGEFERARERLRRAVEILESIPEPDPVATAKLLDDLGRIAWDLDRDRAAAQALFERARTLMEQHGARDVQWPHTLR